MSATKMPSDAVKQITYLAAALKAPRIIEAATRLADQARDAGWTHEDYLAAVILSGLRRSVVLAQYSDDHRDRFSPVSGAQQQDPPEFRRGDSGAR